MKKSSQDSISVRGARVNNLKNISCQIPRNKLTVITGISGSGKSSLAFDTIFAEGQRRYVQSMSSFARQFLGVIEKPDVDEIKGLSPALSIDQKTAIRSPRSTVGTMSEIYDYLRLMFTHIGQPYCVYCNYKMKSGLPNKQSKTQASVNDNQKSRQWFCPKCQHIASKISMSSFSFNSPEGACAGCQGLGVRLEVDPCLVVPNTRLTLNEGAIRPWQRMITGYQWQKKALEELHKKIKFSFNVPIKNLKPEVLRIILYGDKELGFEGVLPGLKKKHKETGSEYVRREIEKYMVKRICPSCKGARLKPDCLKIMLNNKNIYQFCSLSLEDLGKEIKKLTNSHNPLSVQEKEIAEQILEEMDKRVQFMIDVGLSYLTLERGADTLAGGEAQRIRLATQLGSGLIGVIYILDEPTIGLHPKDQKKLLNCLIALRDIGNTVIVVEHEKSVIKAADYIIDVGPGAGQGGGKIVKQGCLKELKVDQSSITAQYLRGKKDIRLERRIITSSHDFLEIQGARQFNLKDINVKIPVGSLTCVTGVSGSGKSSLISHTLVKKLRQHFYQAKETPGIHRAIKGIEKINKVINITQSPIGRNVRSNPATYTGLLSLLRELFASQPLAEKKHFTPAQFSFNLKIGRCENCRGDGILRFEMHFLPDVHIVCKSCRGKRFAPETLAVKYMRKSIADVLQMTVDEAYEFFRNQPQILGKLEILRQVGLGYIQLGQNATDLSGGEAQRVKLATELSRASTGQTLYVLDEPTSGLHFDDINRLLKVLSELVNKGNTVVIIEHNLDVIKNSDWIIDLGPEGGDKGGRLIVQGMPEKVVKCPSSYTGQFLKKVLKKS